MSEEHVASICNMCCAAPLRPLQISKIFNLYTSIDEIEQKVPISFIRTIQAKLQERPDRKDNKNLLMDLKSHFPVRFPFNHSAICLDEDIEIPGVLNLPILEKV